MMGVLDGKVAIVTGATSGIGARIVEVFVCEGATVVFCGRRTDLGEELARRLGDRGTFRTIDVTDETAVAALVATTVRDHERIDVLVNCAGESGDLQPTADTDLDTFRSDYNVHVCGALATMKHTAPTMLARGRGSMINVACASGRIAGWSGLGQSAAKAALIQLSRSAAVELGERGVRVNTVLPGPILTGELARSIGMDQARADRTARELEPDFLQALRLWQPIRRAGSTDDVAAAAVWLAGDASTFVNGHDLRVDGGISAGRPASAWVRERDGLATAMRRLSS